MYASASKIATSLLTAEDVWFFLQPLPKTHTSHQYLEDLEWFEAIFKIFACAEFVFFIAPQYQSQINHNFGTVCHTEVYLTFSRLAAKLSEMIANFWGCSLKIQPQSSFDLNGLKNGTHKYLKIANYSKSSKYWWEVWILGRGRKKNVLSIEKWRSNNFWSNHWTALQLMWLRSFK